MQKLFSEFFLKLAGKPGWDLATVSCRLQTPGCWSTISGHRHAGVLKLVHFCRTENSCGEISALLQNSLRQFRSSIVFDFRKKHFNFAASSIRLLWNTDQYDEFNRFFQIDQGKTDSAARNWTNFDPQTDVTTFAFGFCSHPSSMGNSMDRI